MLNAQKKAIPVEEIFGYSSRSNRIKKKYRASSDSESSSDDDAEYSGSAFTKPSAKAKRIFSDNDIEGPPQCKKCFVVIEKPKKKTMMDAYKRCVAKSLCKRCYNHPVSSAYEGISQSIQQRLNYSRGPEKLLTSVDDPKTRMAEISAVSLTPSRSASVTKKLIFTIGTATIRGATRKVILVNGSHFTKALRLHSDVTYMVTINTEDEPLILTMDMSGGPLAVKVDSTPDPTTNGSYALTFPESFPRRFYYQSTRSVNLGGAIIIDGN